MKRILLAIPTAKYIEPQTFKSIYDLIVPEGYEVDFQFFYGYNIDQVRNLIAEWATRYDYLFSVDSDIVLPADCLVKMLAHNSDIVSGIYIQRIPGEQNIEIYGFHPSGATPRIAYEQIAIPGLYNVAGCGFGCVLVNSNVIRAMKYPWFEYHSALDHANTISEDVDFCRKARDVGAAIWVDSSIICDHVGSHTYKLEPYTLQQRLRDLSAEPLLPGAHIGYLRKIGLLGDWNEEPIKPKVIYDIGACVLHWTNEAQKVWSDAEFIAFEAMHETKFLYEERGLRHFNGVLSHVSGNGVEFYSNPWHPGGNSYYKERTGFFTEGHKQDRTTYSLDDIVKANKFPLPDLIKMDVQGAELDVLKGAQIALGHAQDLILELQHTDYNVGAPLHTEVIQYLSGLGFKLVENFVKTDVDGDYHFSKR